MPHPASLRLDAQRALPSQTESDGRRAFRRLSRTFESLAEADYFGNGERERAATALRNVESALLAHFSPGEPKAIEASIPHFDPNDFRKLFWATRARPWIDRIACAWLVHRFVDPMAEVLYVPAANVMGVAERENAVPFDVPDVELGHRGELCSFDAFLEKYGLDDPALRSMAAIVRGADTDALDLTPESAGLHAIANGFHALRPSRFINDHAMLRAESPSPRALG